ncbi:sugar phosphate isomerase/epimerase family protein [Tunturibacter empetritectus]|uniref:Sugar phosphate isomerase/epimerase n=1 Tax=Tunturiibacter lichenicola TaxID=2051959 RepID=A0A7W8J807_9BACT|nr:sugar phosphate isomerase/epimerase family protein [Edaphobacter lichenicola]MBB5344304.1 sugar phosphate isomerase/epimerase [Edaphobacter lichenicola]
MKSVSRRQFVGGSAGLVASLSLPMRAWAATSPFKIAVISDEISQDFDHACSVIANDFGLHYVELREIWGKNLQTVSDAEIAEALKILTKYNLQVTDIASPLFKVDWPGAPKSKYSSKEDLHGAAESAYKQQDEVLTRSISLAKQFKTDKIRCFDFWRLDDVAPYRAAINEKLRASAEITGQHGILLVIENEFACNTATGREAAKTLEAVQSPHFVLNWDPGNAVMRGELDAFPGGWDALPKNRIHHCHCKNAVKDDSGKIVWSPVDKGLIDWTAQYRALKESGYRDAVSLETHWRGAGTPEASTRISWAGMKQCLINSGTF